MRVILIEEDRFYEIRKLMEYECEKIAEDADDSPDFRQGVNEAKRIINYHFVRWAQSHGASCIAK